MLGTSLTRRPRRATFAGRRKRMMKTSWLGLMILGLSALWPGAASAYLMATLTYSNMFERADVVVIATPISTQESEVQLEIDQPEEIKTLVTTVSTQFKVAYLLKGQLDGTTFNYLHLNRKDRKPFSGMFGAVGTFFIEFEDKESKNKSFILFMTKRKDGSFCPAWDFMEGSRAIIPVQQDGDL